MILYYTYKQKTKVFAQSLGEVLSLPTYELKTDLNDKSGFGFMFNALKLAFTDKPYPIYNMPDDIPLEIYVCSPVWGGRMAAPIKYFLENSNLQRTRVNLLLTASIPTEKYRQKALEYLQKLNCTPGDVYLFATSDKVMPDGEVVKEQLCEILGMEMPKDV